uniref:Transcription cofactor vestigial-like protein 4 n=1 Tax=Arion vulgaris TaxID=1028688 RepID=A0A0B7A4S3_9EUPU
MRKLTENEWHSSVSNSSLDPETMESPLDVLSRAASMIETSSRNSDSFYNGNAPSSSSLDSRSSPGKELPTKLLKQDRMRDRQELGAALLTDLEHAERLCNVKKSASTQTQFSSFNCENLPPPPYYTTHDTIARDKLLTSSSPGHIYPSHLPPLPLPPSFLQYSHSVPSYHNSLNAPSSHLPPPHHSLHSASLLSRTSSQASDNRHILTHTSPSPPTTPTLPPPPLTQTRKCSPPISQPLPSYSTASKNCSPPPPQYPSHTRVQVDVQHAPLNLSLSSSPPECSLTPQTRTSAAANAINTSPIGDPDSYRGGTISEESTNHRLLLDKNGSNHETAAQVSDEAIEEHFRRSLGKCYNEPSPPKKVAVHVSEKICSVDDHFARALGDQMWTEIKARSEPPPLDSLPGSVDAHFAKALGAAMWKKLKAENKLVDDVSSTNQQQSQPQQSEEQPTRQKSAPPSPLHKSLVT